MQNRYSLLFFLVLASVGPLLSQIISGRVTDENTGEALPYASIYLQQLGTGATTNVEGRYELSLKPGRNTLVFQY
ncbi:MAG: carboxypeptidase-like regulatory domain-containing protein, partial [Lewinella sp.]